jgi:hypothetical protein
MNVANYGPAQVSIPAVQGNPNGDYDGPKGSLIVDTAGPALYIKTTDEGVKTGWQNLSVATTLSMVADNGTTVGITSKYDTDTDSYSVEAHPV